MGVADVQREEVADDQSEKQNAVERDDNPVASTGTYRIGIAIAAQNPAARIGVASPGVARSSMPSSSSRRSLGGLESADRRSVGEGGLAIGEVRILGDDANIGPTVSNNRD